MFFFMFFFILHCWLNPKCDILYYLSLTWLITFWWVSAALLSHGTWAGYEVMVRMAGHRSPVSCCCLPRYILRYPDTWHFIATDMMIGSREMPTQEAITWTWCKTLAKPHMVSINHIWSIFPGWQGPDCEFDLSRWLSRDDEFFPASQTHTHSQCEITQIFPRQWEYFMPVRAPPITKSFQISIIPTRLWI